MSNDVKPTTPRERTRRLLLDAARELLRSGRPLTVQSVADQAGVSRATAYRYFSSNDSVAVQATMPLHDDPLADPAWPYSRPDPHADLPARAAAVVRSMGEWAFDHAQELRTLLALSLEPDSEARGLSRRGKLRRTRWIEGLLADLPDTVEQDTRQRLAAALLPLFGADAIVWTADVAGLDRDTALDTLAWTASTLVRAVLDESDGKTTCKLPSQAASGITPASPTDALPSQHISRPDGQPRSSGPAAARPRTGL
jgi:AcrR family transcriptional regulator